MADEKIAMQDKDFKWFILNYADLFKRYGKKYLAIKNAEVLGAYDNIREAMDNTNEPPGTFIIQLCNGDESGYTNYIASMNFMGNIG